MNCKTITENIGALCRVKGMSMHELCSNIGVADGYFTRDREDFPLSKILAVASVLNVEPAMLWSKEYTKEIKKLAIDAEIERLKKAKEALDFMPEVDDGK